MEGYGDLWKYHSHWNNNLCKARRKSASAQLSSQCLFKVLVSDTGQFTLGIVKYIIIGAVGPSVSQSCVHKDA